MRRRLLRLREGSGNAEAIRQARAAVRRLGVAVGLWVSDPERPLRILRRWHRRLGRLRDLDVAIEQLAVLPEPLPGGEALRKFLRRRRRRKEKAFRRWMSRARLGRLSEVLGECADRAEERDAGRLRREALRTSASIVRLARRAEALADPRVLHDLRREIRRLCCLLELAGVSKEAGLLKRLLRVRRLGGAWRDRAVCEREAARAARDGGGGRGLREIRRRWGRSQRVRARRFVRAALELGPLLKDGERLFE